MVNIRIWRIVAAGVVLALLSADASGQTTAEARAKAAFAKVKTPAVVPGAKKSDCPEECQRRAAAAFAFAALKEQPAGSAVRAIVAPMPRIAKPPAKRDQFRGSDGRLYQKCADGVYREVKDVSEVTPANPFCGVPFDLDHRCDRCGHQSAPGTGTWLVRGTNADGTRHRHECPLCHHQWWH